MLIRLLRIGFGLFVLAGIAQSMGVPVFEMFFLDDVYESIDANFDDSDYEDYDPNDRDGDGYDDDDSGYEHDYREHDY